MDGSKAKKALADLFQESGITINGTGDADIQVHDERFYERVLREGSVGLGESYMDGWWDCPALDRFFCQILREKVDYKAVRNLILVKEAVKSHIFNWQSSKKAKHDIGYSYDIGNDLFKAMLDERLVYSCGYWQNATNIDEAQTAKLDLICRKMGLKPGMKVLDIGAGWGSFCTEKSALANCIFG